MLNPNIESDFDDQLLNSSFQRFLQNQPRNFLRNFLEMRKNEPKIKTYLSRQDQQFAHPYLRSLTQSIPD